MDKLRITNRWSLDTWFVSFRAQDYLDFRDALASDLAAFCIPAEKEELPQAVASFEALSARHWHLRAYLGALSADNANDEAVKADLAWCASLDAECSKLGAALQAALAALDETEFSAVLEAPQLAGVEHAVRRLRERGARLMRPDLEAVAAELGVNGIAAWGRLYESLTGKLEFTMTFPDGHIETVPMSRRRALMSESDRALRKAAFRDGQAPWHTHEETLAAALNAIAGTRLALYKRRGIDHFLASPLHDASLSRETLEAMLQAIRAHAELPRRVLRAAARLQGTPALDFFDLEAPHVEAPEDQKLTWEEACGTVDRSFSAAYPALGAYFGEMLAQGWVEAQPRPGKRPGAFCTRSWLRREERVYMTWYDTMHDMVTLAHEVGHAWHSRVLRSARPFATAYPMTLAETASNFGEMILMHGLMQDPGLKPAMRAHLLDQEMLRAHAYLLNIPMRYEFEHSFYAERRGGEVPVSRLRELMTRAQHKIYRDTLHPNGTDDMFWASKMHFFVTGVSFYNFPYVFGYLLSQALFARFKAEGSAFLKTYERFLALSGSGTCESVVQQTLGADLQSPEFWAVGITSLEERIVEFEVMSRQKIH